MTKKSRLLYAMCGLTIIMVITLMVTPTILAQPSDTNDTWYDTHWGGDTGEEQYSEPVINPDDDSSDICSTWGCTSGFVVVGICFSTFLKRKKMNRVYQFLRDDVPWKKMGIVLVIVALFSVCGINCIADEVTISSISPDSHYDSRPNVWENYVVWRRAINQNENRYIELREPSWIMVHNLATGKSWNITPANTVMRGDIYHHAESPDIWNGKIIYEAQASSNSYDTRLFMYNVSSGDTWQIPIQSTKYAHGHLHVIYGDWITYTHKENNKRQAYLYNYRDGIYRTIIGKGEPYSVYGLVMNNKYVVLTVTNQTNNFNILVYNIGTTEITNLEYNNTQIIATSIYDNKVGLSLTREEDNVTNWDVNIHNIESNEKTFIFNAHGLLIWGDYVAYQMNGDIHVGEEQDLYVITERQTQYLGDLHGDTIVWMDNINSGTTYGDTRDDFDIYIRTILTDKEIFNTNIYVLSIIVIILVILAMIALKARERRDMGG